MSGSSPLHPGRPGSLRERRLLDGALHPPPRAIQTFQRLDGSSSRPRGGERQTQLAGSRRTVVPREVRRRYGCAEVPRRVRRKVAGPVETYGRLSELECSTVGPATLVSYIAEVEEFKAWCKSRGLSIATPE